MIFVADLYGEREAQGGSRVVPAQLFGNRAWKALKGSQTVPRDNSKRDFVAIFEFGEVVEKEALFALDSLDVCPKSRAECTDDCPKRHQDRLPLEKVLSAPFQMEIVPSSASTAAASSSSSSSAAASEDSPAYTYRLPPGIRQAALEVAYSDASRHGVAGVL